MRTTETNGLCVFVPFEMHIANFGAFTDHLRDSPRVQGLSVSGCIRVHGDAGDLHDGKRSPENQIP
jgi:hypothetical protein